MKTKHLLSLITTLTVGASAAFAQQASLTLRGCDTSLWNHNDTAWTLAKAGVYQQVGPNAGVGTVTWTVVATRGATSDNFIEVDGTITIENTGSADATIGNIVVNLQKRAVYGQPTWVSAAADMADGTVGNLATNANIAAAASQEDPAANAAVGANNYTKPGGGAGVFIKTAGSGTVEFTDVSDNTAFSLVPAKVIPPGGTVTLKYIATYNNTILGIPDGAQVRTEAIVTFGNAGGRGDSGASSPNIDINGSGVIDADEAHVRSVPCRVSKDLPPLERCNDTVVLADTDPDSMSTTGTASWSDFVTDIGNGTGLEVIATTQTRFVTVNVTGGLDGGDVCNTALLTGDSSSVVVGSYSFAGCKGVELTALSCVTIEETPSSRTLPGCGYTQGGWGAVPHGGNVGALLYTNFAAVYPSGEVVIGGAKTVTFKTKTSIKTGSAQNRNQVPSGATIIQIIYNDQGKATEYIYQLGVVMQALQAITAYMGPEGGGTPGVLDSNLENPTSTSAGIFAKQVLALKLNVDFGAAGKITPIGGYKLCDTGSSLNGKTISEILDTANTALGGGALPAGYSISTLNDLVTSLNEAFDNCTQSDWSKQWIRSVCP